MSPVPRILSISSDQSVFETRNLVLVAAGFEVVGCFHGEGALQAFVKERFDAVVVGGSVTAPTRHALFHEFKRLRPSVTLVVIQRTGESIDDASDADIVLDSLDGPQRLIEVLSSIPRAEGEPSFDQLKRGVKSSG